MKQWIIAALLLAPAVEAGAACGKARTVFACTTAQGKEVEVCDAGATLSYRFGRPGRPEMMLSVPRSAASTSQWPGIGRYISYSVDIPNGHTVYSVFWGADRNAEDHPVEAGVNVLVNGQSAAIVKCGGERIVQNIEGIDLKPTE
ncbi:hypothetical protein Ga0061063_0856 [Gulbenkiania indica]|uniref:Uncharacterized protein n=2 Tax=Gulbenkiania TaxID=397456 RepID=A0A0K6GTS4_9NEIS|nr:hypothetical protein [Gulbenkiania indica]TCW31911.1 hypothetical protein EV669_104281 [Gulbenkiania mobilis]CUA82007.1 hypothetical protein Ga0061063_0856 [Gulbenkiania indica]